MDNPTAVAAFASVLGTSAKLAEKGFEISPLDEQARDLLQTVQQVAGQLDDARSLLRQNSRKFSDHEKRMFDDTFYHCEDAIRHVATLVERPRTDMPGGQAQMNTRLVFFLRNSPNINVSQMQLGLASQSLNASIAQLNSRDMRLSSPAGYSSPQSPGQGEWKPPTTYEETQFLSAGRRRNIQRRANAMGYGGPNQPNQPNQPAQPVQPVQTSHTIQPVQRQHSRSHSPSRFFIPAVPTIAELVGDETFPRSSRNHDHDPIPIITVADAIPPPSDPIVIESEPIVLSPPTSPDAQSQSTNSPPHSPPIRRRESSVSTSTNSDGVPQPSTFTSPQSTGVQTPPTSWAPQFPEPRPSPGNFAPQQNVVMPMPADFSTSRFSNPHPNNANIPPHQQQHGMAASPTNLLNHHYSDPLPRSSHMTYPPPHVSDPHARPNNLSYPPVRISDPVPRPTNLSYPPPQVDRRISATNSWAPQQFQDHRPSTALAPGPNLGIGIQTSMENLRPSSSSGLAPFPSNSSAPGGTESSSGQQYFYTPSLARRGQGGRNRSHSWLDARVQERL